MNKDEQIVFKLRQAQVPFTVFGQTLMSLADSTCKELQKLIDTWGFVDKVWRGRLHNYLITGEGSGTVCELMCKTLVLVGQQARIVSPRRWMHVDAESIGGGYFVVPRIHIEDEGCDWWGFGEFLSEHTAKGGGLVMGAPSLELPAGIANTIEKTIVYSEHFKVNMVRPKLPQRMRRKDSDV